MKCVRFFVMRFIFEIFSWLIVEKMVINVSVSNKIIIIVDMIFL